MNTLNQKVSIAEKIGYSLGDCSANFVFQMMMIYQTKFYTDVFCFVVVFFFCEIL